MAFVELRENIKTHLKKLGFTDKEISKLNGNFIISFNVLDSNEKKPDEYIEPEFY